MKGYSGGLLRPPLEIRVPEARSPIGAVFVLSFRRVEGMTSSCDGPAVALDGLKIHVPEDGR